MPAAAAERLTIAGQERTFALSLPAKRPGHGGAMPLVIVPHGGGGTGERMRRWLGLEAIAARAGFAVAYATDMANLPEDMGPACKPPSPRPMLMINGTADPL